MWELNMIEELINSCGVVQRDSHSNIKNVVISEEDFVILIDEISKTQKIPKENILKDGFIQINNLKIIKSISPLDKNISIITPVNLESEKEIGLKMLAFHLGKVSGFVECGKSDRALEHLNKFLPSLVGTLNEDTQSNKIKDRIYGLREPVNELIKTYLRIDMSERKEDV